jgi:hypothetical protein
MESDGWIMDKVIKHVNVRIPFDLWKKARVALFIHKKTFQSFFIEKLEEFLENCQKEAK